MFTVLTILIILTTTAAAATAATATTAAAAAATATATILFWHAHAAVMFSCRHVDVRALLPAAGRHPIQVRPPSAFCFVFANS